MSCAPFAMFAVPVELAVNIFIYLFIYLNFRVIWGFEFFEKIFKILLCSYCQPSQSDSYLKNIAVINYHLIIILFYWDRQALKMVYLAPQKLLLKTQLNEVFALWSESNNIMQDQDGQNINPFDMSFLICSRDQKELEIAKVMPISFHWN